MEMNTPRKFLSFIVPVLLLVLFVSCQIEEPLPKPTSTKAPVPTATFTPTPTPTPLPPEIQYLRDNPHAGPIPEGGVARLGKGTIMDIVYSDQLGQMLILTSLGIYVHQSPDFELVNFFPLVSDALTEAEFSPDGSYFSLVANNNDVLVLETETWGEIIRFESVVEHHNSILLLDFTNDGHYFYVMEHIRYVDGEYVNYHHLRVWQVNGWKEIVSEEGKFVPCSEGDSGCSFTTPPEIVVSPDSTLLALGGTDSLQVLDLRTGEVIQARNEVEVWDEIAFSNQGRYVAVSNSSSAIIIDLFGSGDVGDLEIPYDLRILEFAFSEDDKLLFVAERDKLHLWDVALRQKVSEIPAAFGRVTAIFASPFKNHIIVSGWENVLVVNYEDTAEPKIERVFVHHLSTRNAISPDGNYLAWHANSGQTGFIDLHTYERIIDLEGIYTSRAEFMLGTPFLVYWSESAATLGHWPEQSVYKEFDGFSTLFFNDMIPLKANNRLVTSSAPSSVVTIWDIEFVQKVHSVGLGGTFGSNLDVSQDERLLALNSVYTTYIWDFVDDQLPVPFAEDRTSLLDIEDVIISPDGSRIFQRSLSGDSIWQVDTGEVISWIDIPFEGHVDASFTEDNRNLILADELQIATIDVTTGKLIKSVKMSYPIGIEPSSFSMELNIEDGIFVSYGKDSFSRWLLVWDINTGDLINKMELAFLRGSLSDFSFVNDDCLIASEVVRDENTAIVWNVNTQEKATITEDITQISSAYVFAELGYLATTANDGTIVLWELPPLCE